VCGDADWESGLWIGSQGMPARGHDLYAMASVWQCRSFDEIDVSVSLLYRKQLLQGKAEKLAQENPIDPQVSDDEDVLAPSVDDPLECRDHSVA
jgi:hypothetical protein